MPLVSCYIVGPASSDQLGSGGSAPGLSDQHFGRQTRLAGGGGGGKGSEREEVKCRVTARRWRCGGCDWQLANNLFFEGWGGGGVIIRF